MTSSNARVAARSVDPVGDALVHVIGLVLTLAVAVVALPLLLPFLVNRLVPDVIAAKTRFWIIWKWHWLLNVAGILLVVLLVAIEGVFLVGWIRSGDATTFFDGDWTSSVLPKFGPWAAMNLLSGILLLPVLWSMRRRWIAELVRTRRIPDVLRQERIEAARKRAADSAAAKRMGVKLDGNTGRIAGITDTALTVPHQVAGRQSFGFITRATVSTWADRFHDTRTLRDWADPSGEFVVLPETSSAVRALIVAESGSGKTVLLNGLVLCALENGWPVFVLDAKGDPADAESLAALAEAEGHTASVGGAWNLFNGTAEQVTAKLMRLMPPADGANQHYLDEIRGVLQAVQDASPLRSVADVRERLTDPGPYVRDQYDLGMVNQPVDRNGTTAGLRAMHSLLVALRPLERWIGADGWSYDAPPADVTIIPLSPVDEAQAKLGDLLMLDLRGFLAARLDRRDKSPVVVIVDEFPQLVTGGQDPGDTAGSLFETARSAGVGLVLATQSPAGLSNDETRRRRALTSGAALIFGRSKDPEDMVKYAGTVVRMESSTRTLGDEQGTSRAQHSFVIPPQDVREAADGAFWMVQGGAIAGFRALPHITPAPRARVLVPDLELVDTDDESDEHDEVAP
jgi:membrane protein implicated in regulation of membrane protease activity